MNQKLWKECIEFHGHECPGLAIGFRACMVAKEILGLSFSEEEEIVCIAELDSCPIDAIKYIAGCSIEDGTLQINKTGNPAFLFLNNDSGESLRLVLKPRNKEMNKEESKNFILNAPANEVFDIIQSI